ncbi:MAG: glyoxalase [Acidobacteria bacterium]|nr:MAG: glyoxalase [Acidobacteriota bacterium]
MHVDSYTPGTPSWVDLGIPDIAAATEFYSGLFGWQIEDMGPDAGGYAMASLDGEPVAGLGPQQSPGPPYWTVYVTVEDAAAVAKLVQDNGGQVAMPPMQVMDAGTMAVFQDSVGAFISVWEPADHKGAGLVGEEGTFVWAELTTDQLDDASRFYGSVFGWESETSSAGGMEYTEFKLGETPVAGMMPRPPMLPDEVPSYWGVYFASDDCDATAEKVKELGGSVIVPPMDIPPGRFAVVADPAGASFSIMTTKGDLRAAP